MPILTPEEHERLQMELVAFAKEELERRQKAPIYVRAEDVEAQLQGYFHAAQYSISAVMSTSERLPDKPVCLPAPRQAGQPEAALDISSTLLVINCFHCLIYDPSTLAQLLPHRLIY